MKECENKTRTIEAESIELSFDPTFHELIAEMFEFICSERKRLENCLYFDTDLTIYELRDKHSQTKGE